MKNNKQFAPIAAATNGNGHKKEGIKVPFQKVESPETPDPTRETFAEPPKKAEESRIEIVPTFDCLTTKGKEMFADMGSLENAKLFLDGLMMEVGYEPATIAGLLVLLDAIKEKAQEPFKDDHPSDFIGYLQDYLFNWTREADDCTGKHIEAVKSGNFVVEELIEFDPDARPHGEGIMPDKRKSVSRIKSPDVLDESELEEPVIKPGKIERLKGEEPAEILPEAEKPVLQQPKQTSVQERCLEIWANKLAYVLESDKVPGEIKYTLGNIFSDAANEVGVHIDDPEIIKSAFMLFMKKADFGYGKGVLHSIQTIIDDLRRDALEGELEQFERHLEMKSPSSAVSDDFAARIAEFTDPKDLAVAFSGLLNNPIFPTRLFNVIADELSAQRDSWASPDNILFNFEQMQKTENGGDSPDEE